MEREKACLICLRGNELLLGECNIGDRFSVRLRIRCPEGSIPIGVWHTHPGGDSIPSSQDIKEARRVGLKFVCVEGSQGLKCFKV